MKFSRVRRMFRCAILSALIFLSYSSRAQYLPSEDEKNLFYKEASELFDEGKYGAAKEKFISYSRVFPDEAAAIDAAYYAALCSARLLNEDTEAEFLNFIHNHPYHIKAKRAYFELEKFAFYKRKYSEAISYYDEIQPSMLNENELAEAKFKLAYSHIMLKEYEKALPVLKEIIYGNHPYYQDAVYYYAWLLYNKESYNEALPYFQEILMTKKYGNTAPVYVCSILYKTQKYDSLIQYGSKILLYNQKLKEKSTIQLLVGMASYDTGDYKNAIAPFTNYITDNNKATNFREVTYKLGFSLYRMEEYVKSAAYFKTSTGNAQDSLSQNAYYHLGKCFVELQQWETARNAFMLASKMDFNKSIKEDATFNFAKLCFQLKYYSGATISFKNFISAYPKSVHFNEAKNLLAEVLFYSNNYGEAIKYFEPITVTTENSILAYQRANYYYGLEKYNEQKWDTALKCFHTASLYNNDISVNHNAQFWYAEVLYNQQKYEEAYYAYTKFISIKDIKSNDNYAGAIYGTGWCNFKMKKYPEALQQFRNYVSSADKSKNAIHYADALLRAGDCEFIAKNFDGAIGYYDAVIAMNSASIDYAYYQKAFSLYRKGNYAETIRNYDMIITKFSNSPLEDDALYGKARAYFSWEKYNDCITTLQYLIKDFPYSSLLPKSYLRMAEAQFNLAQYDNAVTNYKTVAEKFGDSDEAVDALKGLQTVLSSLGRTEEYNAILKKYLAENPQSTAFESLTYESAELIFQNRNYSGALTEFNNYLEKFPNGKYVTDAQFYSAESFYRMNQYDMALGLFYKVYSAPRNNYTVRAVGRAAQITFLKKDFDKSVILYDRLETLAESYDEQINAQMGSAATLYADSQYVKALDILQKILSNPNTNNSQRNDASLLTGKLLYETENTDSAMSDFQKIVSQTNDETGAEAQYWIGKVLLRQEKYKECADAMLQLKSLFPAYNDWVAKGFLLLADSYAKMNDAFQARATLQSIIDNYPSSDITEEAKKKLFDLSQMEMKQDTTQTDTIQK